MVEKVSYYLFMTYLIISQIMTLVYFIDFCKEWDNILKIIFIAPFLAELKGLFWIFLI